MSNKHIPTAVIYGLKGAVLTEEEKQFFQEQNPLGFILFKRNIEDKEQVRSLVTSLKACLSHEAPVVLIDQEGGRVARLRPPVWRDTPAAERLASLPQATEAIKLNGRLIASELSELGINVNCAPIADLRIEGSHDIIGDRAYGGEPEQVVNYARAMADGLSEGGVIPIVKHIPGHGRAKADSHESLPVVDQPLELLEQTDFVPFKELADLPWAMTAHITFTALDEENPTTLSSKVISYIRNEIGFKGVLLSDDLSMKALSGSYQERTEKALDAGCDIILHCNGDMVEMQAIAEAIRPIPQATFHTICKSIEQTKQSSDVDVAEAEQRLSALC